ncbi:hypothetical protein [Micromonospora rubida]
MSPLGAASGMLLRQVDRAAVRLDPARCDKVGRTATQASGRVLLSLREHTWRTESTSPLRTRSGSSPGAVDSPGWRRTCAARLVRT